MRQASSETSSGTSSNKPTGRATSPLKIKGTMAEKNPNWGGYREGGGRPTTDRNVAVTVRVSQEAADKLKTVKNKSEFIDRIIKENV